MSVPGRKRKNRKSVRQGLEGHRQNRGTDQRYAPGRRESVSSNRVQATNVGSMLHDESDVISFRQCLKNEVIASSRLLDLLTTQAIPLDKIQPPEMFPKGALEFMMQQLETQKRIIEDARRISESKVAAATQLDDNVRFYKEGIDVLADKLYDPETVKRVESEFRDKFKLQITSGNVVFHKNKFSQLSSNRTKAPSDYWEKYKRRLEEQKEEERRIKEQEEERKRQEEMALSVDPISSDLTSAAKNDEVEQQQLSVPDPNDPNVLDDVFGEEPFQNDFDDGFGDLDTAFF